jgi:hypothetical protein
VKTLKPESDCSVTDNLNTYPSKAVLRIVMCKNSVIRSLGQFNCICQGTH